MRGPGVHDQPARLVLKDPVHPRDGLQQVVVLDLLVDSECSFFTTHSGQVVQAVDDQGRPREGYRVNLDRELRAIRYVLRDAGKELRARVNGGEDPESR